MATIGTDIAFAKKLLLNDQVIGLPTETVYGLAGNALHEKSIAKIFSVKNRPSFDPLIAHVDTLDKVHSIVEKFPLPLQKLAAHFWPGPLTLLLPKKSHVPFLLTSGLKKVAVRIPNHPLALELLGSIDFPLAAPSANPFGYVSPTTAKHVNDQLGEKIPYILNGGNCEVGLESTIVGFEDGQVVIHRLGGISLEEIEKIIGPVKRDINESSNPKAPGMLKAHYSPTKKLLIGNIEDLMNAQKNNDYGIISFKQSFLSSNPEREFVLSASGDMHEAAANLFSALRKLDDLDIDLILTELVPENGLGLAINDRLKRAAVS
ncbi:MAG: L-threonylcarbamoyladenylate synthase [Cyclobacteriaceae bacterium]